MQQQANGFDVGQFFKVKGTRRDIFYLSLVLVLTFGSLIHATNNDWRVFFLAVTGIIILASIGYFSVALGIIFDWHEIPQELDPGLALFGVILILVFWTSMPLIFKFISNIPMWRRIPYSYFCIMMFGYFLYSIAAWVGNQGYT